MISVLKERSVVLIGMPGVGKSTIGLLLAKNLGMDFVDTDIIIQVIHGKTLQEIIRDSGYLTLRHYEQQVLLNLNNTKKVIATGGSAVYSAAGMAHLKANASVVFLDLDLQQLTQRVTNFDNRGIARRDDQSFEDLFAERRPLYQQHADFSVDCNDLNINQCLQQITDKLTDIQYSAN